MTHQTISRTALSTHRQRSVVLALGLASLPWTMLQSVAAAVMPDAEAQFGLPVGAASWVLVGYLLVGVVVSAIGAVIARRIGERLALVLALAIGAVGCLVSALAPDLVVLIIGRCLQGVAVAASAIGLSIARRTLEPRFAAQATAAITAVFGLGGVIGLTVAGPLVDAIGFRGLFLTMAGLILISALVVVLAVAPIPARRDVRIDIVSAILIGISLSALLIGLELFGDGLPIAVPIAVLAAAVVGLVLWVARERRRAAPLIDVRQLARRPVNAAVLASLLLGMAMFAAFVFIPVVITDPAFGLGGTATMIGLLLLPSAAATFLTSFTVPGVARRIGDAATLLIGCLGVAASYALLAVWHSSSLAIIVSGVIQGIAVALATTSVLHIAISAVPLDDVAATTGVTNIARLIGGALGSQLTAMVLAATSAHGAPTAEGFILTTLLAASVGVLGAATAMLCFARRASRPIIADTRG